MFLFHMKMNNSEESKDKLKTVSVVRWLACWPLVPEFAGSNLAEVVGGEVKESVPCPSFAACKRT
jgi:hypothetical protein